MRPPAHIYSDEELDEQWVCTTGDMMNGVQWKRVGETTIGDGLARFKIEKLTDASFQPGGFMKNHSLHKARRLRDILGPEALARNQARREAAMMEAMTGA